MANAMAVSRSIQTGTSSTIDDRGIRSWSASIFFHMCRGSAVLAPPRGPTIITQPADSYPFNIILQCQVCVCVCVCVSECVGLGEGDVWKWNDWAVGLDCGHWDAGFDHWTIEASSSHVSISGVIWVMNFGRVTKYNIQRRTGISALSGISNEWRTQHDPTRWSHFHCLLYIFFFFVVVFHSIGFFHLNLNFLVFVVVVVAGVGVGVVHIEIQGEISFIDLFICPLLILFLCVRFRWWWWWWWWICIVGWFLWLSRRCVGWNVTGVGSGSQRWMTISWQEFLPIMNEAN